MGSSIVFGASGGIGAAFCAALGPRCLGLSRGGTPALELSDEASIAAAAAFVREHLPPPTLMIDATGFLHGQGYMPEKSLAALDAAHMALSFRLNAIGPALLMKHFLALMPRGEAACFVTLSARVGSIGDNRAGGWHSYRAAKAALNQLVRTAAIELAVKRPLAVCVAMHPGTVATGLSAPFAKSGLRVRAPAAAVDDMLGVIRGLTSADSGGFFGYDGAAIPW